MTKRHLAKASIFALCAAATPAFAQSAVDAFKDEILVTATKKADAENVQEVPLAVTAYGEDQLDALKVRDLGNLSYSMPNVGLEDIGTTRGVANFSIRGLGVNSSIPSIDPAVGTFVDGVYLGQNGGVVFDIFDLESVEVLRGPQGILFGRNVTGGAVLLNSKRPNLSQAEGKLKLAAESGLRGTGNNYYAQGYYSIPLIEDVLAFKLSGYYNNDRGWFDRYLGGPNLEARLDAIGGTASALDTAGFPIATNAPDAFANFGKAETWVVRPQILWQPADNFSALIRYEHFDSEGDGPASQNHSGFRPGFDTVAGVAVQPIPSTNVFFSAPKDSFTFSIDEPGNYTSRADSVTAEFNLDVGEGTITNIFGWRDTRGTSVGDIDATPFWLFHSFASNDYRQISNEIRYAGRFFDRVDLTAGFYYFDASHVYQENRFILGGFRNLFGGGLQDSRNWAVFAQADIDITDTFTLIGGGRYTNERKSAVLSNITLNPVACSVAAGTCSVELDDEFTWKNFTPKIGFTWAAREWMNVYGHWTQGVRSGGYNFRNTSVIFPTERFDEETVNAYEIGFKAQPGDGRATINASVFVNDISDLQRELNLADSVAGVVQLIRNTADATVFGFEIEAQVLVTDNLIFQGNLGRLDGEYDRVLFNLNSDFIDTNGNTTQQAGEPDIIDDRDLRLDIPRLSPWTWGAGFIHSMEVAGHDVSTRLQYSHRDPTAYTDNNLGILLGAEIIDASVAIDVGAATVSLYGQNLLNEVTHGGETQLPGTLGGGSFAPLNKGRVVGLEIEVNF
ncbi:MAG TPA: TonB-dependent receptor [Parvularcula sp.]|nr:TonB-dependent receptor [Parvularcula sp.]